MKFVAFLATDPTPVNKTALAFHVVAAGDFLRSSTTAWTILNPACTCPPSKPCFVLIDTALIRVVYQEALFANLSPTFVTF